MSEHVSVFVVMVNDRHTDPEPEVFTTADAAIAYARSEVAAYARDPADIEEEKIDGWLYYARYSVEGDSVWIVEKELRR